MKNNKPENRQMSYSSYSELKSVLKNLENDKKYFFMKRYYLFRYMIITLISISFIVCLYYLMYVLNNYKMIEQHNIENHIHLNSYEGSVKYLNEKDIVKEFLKANTVISNNYTVFTGTSAKAEISLSDTSFIILNEETSVKFTWESKQQMNALYKKVILEKGSIVIDSSGLSITPNFWVETAGALLSVKNCKAIINTDKGSYFTFINCQSGRMILSLKTLYTTIDIDNSDLENLYWQQILPQLENMQFVINEGEKLKIPAIIDINKDELIILEHMFKLNNSGEKVKEFLFYY